MTKNRKNKRAVRDLAARQQVKYTAAGRAADLLAPTGPEAAGHTWSTGVPVLITADQVAALLPERLADRIIVTPERLAKFVPASVVDPSQGGTRVDCLIDARGGYHRSDPLRLWPAEPARGSRNVVPLNHAHNMVAAPMTRAVALPDGQDAVVSWHPQGLGAPQIGFSGPDVMGGKPGVVVLVRYPDGFSVAIAGPARTEWDTHWSTVWESHILEAPDTLLAMLSVQPSYAGPRTWCEDADPQTLLSDGVLPEGRALVVEAVGRGLAGLRERLTAAGIGAWIQAVQKVRITDDRYSLAVASQPFGPDRHHVDDSWAEEVPVPYLVSSMVEQALLGLTPRQGLRDWHLLSPHDLVRSAVSAGLDPTASRDWAWMKACDTVEITEHFIGGWRTVAALAKTGQAPGSYLKTHDMEADLMALVDMVRTGDPRVTPLTGETEGTRLIKDGPPLCVHIDHETHGPLYLVWDQMDPYYPEVFQFAAEALDLWTRRQKLYDEVLAWERRLD